MNLHFWEKGNLEKLGRLCRRAVALALALSLELPAASLAYNAQGNPTAAVPGEAPTITVEANAVVDRWYDPTSTVMDVKDYLTGELEVAIRVQSGKIGTEWQAFDTIGVALKYSPILTPYTFTLLDGIDLSGKTDWLPGEKEAKRAPGAVDLTGTQDFTTMTTMQTLKSKNIATATGHVSGEAGKGGYLFLEVEANRPLVLEEDTVLAVVTFHYDVEQYQIVAADAAQWLTPLAATAPPSGGGGTATVDEDPGTDPGTGTTDPVCLLQFATRAEMGGRYGKYEMEYSSANNDFLYSADPETTDINFMQLDDKTTDLYHGAPTPERVNFRLVNQTTYNDGGLTLDDLATVLFYDWDDTLIGVLIVPRDGDARKIVNDYVRDHFIHKDLRNTDVASRARIDNYRGKYPAKEPMADGAVDSPSTIITDGDATPLTNKLDYVFFKRPMEQAKITVGEGADAHEVDIWKQSFEIGDDGERGIWDDYPYLHGWAVVPDYRHPEKVWTTLGVGELTNYSGANGGGYKDIGTVPATLTPEDDFAFADFDFRVKNDNSLNPGSIYAVKAVYEPGEDLLNSAFQYRMISEPYYNKLNNVAAASGGAYSVDVTFERASDGDGLTEKALICGVARMREPFVRQDTTTDLLWEAVTEEREDLVVNHNLPNASLALAYSDKNNTTYTKVDVKNVEEISFSLTLSGRQNKVDYYLQEAYNSNFVGGGARTENDYYGRYLVRGETTATEDNYNYFVDQESNEGDNWYDSSYEERDGTHGFVLSGTLNQIMEMATLSNRGEITTFTQYTTVDNLKDINLRTANGDLPGLTNLSSLRTGILNAAEAAKPEKNGGSTKYWNTDRNCAQLTYHQLQGFIIDGSLDHDENPIMSGSSVALTWCHLHKACVDAVSSKPKSWAELIQKARTSPEDIEALTPTEMETLAHLRADANGTPFASVAAFRSAMELAVAGTTGTPSWDQIQANILGETLPALEERTYWWYDGTETAPRLNSVADTVAAAQDIVTPVKMPDGTTMARYDKLNQLKPAFEENAASATVARSWNNATKNLCITKGDSQGEKFDSFADFRSAFVDAVTEAEKAKVTLGPTATAEELKEYWQKLQYRILNPTKPFSATKLPEMDGYWWYDGNSKIGDLPSLLAAAKRALPVSQGGEGDSTILDLFTLEDLYKLKDLHFRKSFKGEKFDGTADLNAFIGAVKQFVQLGNDVTIATSTSSDGQKTTSWNHLQYYLIHSGDTGFDSKTIKAGASEERTYYWWRDGKDGEVYALTADAGDGFPTLLEAVYRTVANGNKMAYDQLTADAIAGYRLVSSYGTETTWDTLPKFGADGGVSMDDLKTKLADLYKEIVKEKDDYKTVSWRQVQHYLLGKGYVSNSALAGDNTLIPSDKRDDENGYWWREGNEKPGGGGPVKSDLDYFLEEVDRFINDPNMTDLELVGKKDLTPATSAVDRYLLNGKLGLWGGTVRKTATKPLEDLSPTYQTRVRDNVLALAKQLRADPNVTTCVGILDWYVLQYYSIYATANKYTIGKPIKTHAEAVQYYVETLKEKTKKDWVPAEYRDTTLDPVTTSLMMMQPNSMAALTPADQINELTGVIAELTDAIREEPELAEEYAQEIADLMAILEELKALLAGEEAVAPTQTPLPTESPIPTETALPAESPLPTESAEPTETVRPDDPIGPTTSPEPAESATPTESPEPTESTEPTESVVPTESPDPTESVGPDDPIGPSPTPTPTESPDPAESVTPSPTPTSTPEEDLTDPDVPTAESPEPTESSALDDKEHLVTVPEEVDPPFISEGQQDQQGEEEQGEGEPADSGGEIPVTATAWTKQKMTLEPVYQMWYTMVEPEGKGKKSLWRTLPILYSAGPPGRLLAASPPEENITLTIGRTLT